MSVLVSFILKKNVFNCPILDSIVPRDTSQVCNNTVYSPFQSPLYFRKTSLIVPFRTVLSQKSLPKYVTTPCIVRFRHLCIFITSFIVPFQRVLSQTTIFYCPFRHLGISKNNLNLPISDIFVLKKSTWLDIISNWRFELNDLLAGKY